MSRPARAHTRGFDGASSRLFYHMSYLSYMRKADQTRGPPLLVAVALVAVALAGCTAEDDPTPQAPATLPVGNAAPILTEDGRDLREDLRPADVVPAPSWAVGDWFGVHAYFGGLDAEGTHFELVVVGRDEGSYQLAASDPTIAKQAALYGIPLVGALAQEDLAMASEAGAWDFFSFPLSDGATWEGTMPNIAFDVIEDDTVPLAMTAEYREDIETPEGPMPGFVVTGRAPGGELVIATDFIPAVGWFANFVVYDIDPQQDPIEIRATSMGHGSGWTGTYYRDMARELLFNVDAAGFDDAPPEGEPFVQPSPHARFTVSGDAGYLVGYLYAVAIFGARGIVLQPPEGEARHIAAAGIEGEEFLWIDEPASPGEWTVTTAGAGGMSWGEAWLNEIIESKGTL